jgi:hypothetical protein
VSPPRVACNRQPAAGGPGCRGHAGAQAPGARGLWRGGVRALWQGGRRQLQPRQQRRRQRQVPALRGLCSLNNPSRSGPGARGECAVVRGLLAARCRPARTNRPGTWRLTPGMSAGGCVGVAVACLSLLSGGRQPCSCWQAAPSCWRVGEACLSCVNSPSATPVKAPRASALLAPYPGGWPPDGATMQGIYLRPAAGRARRRGAPGRGTVQRQQGAAGGALSRRFGWTGERVQLQILLNSHSGHNALSPSTPP